jgi:hypothetical protein
MELAACQLSGAFPLSTVYSRVRAAWERGTYDDLRLREEQEISRLVVETECSDIAVGGGNNASGGVAVPTISPVTMDSSTSTMTNDEITASFVAGGTNSGSSKSTKETKQVFWKSSRQTAKC